MEEIVVDVNELIDSYIMRLKELNKHEIKQLTYLYFNKEEFVINDVVLKFNKLSIPIDQNSEDVHYEKVYHDWYFDEYEHEEDEVDFNKKCPLCNKFVSDQNREATICVFADEEKVKKRILEELKKIPKRNIIEYGKKASFQSIVFEKVTFEKNYHGEVAYVAKFKYEVKYAGKISNGTLAAAYTISERVSEKDFWDLDETFIEIQDAPHETEAELEEELEVTLKPYLKDILESHIVKRELELIRNTTYDILDIQNDEYEEEFMIWFKLNNNNEILFAQLPYHAGIYKGMHILISNEDIYKTFEDEYCLSLNNHLLHCFKKELQQRKELRLKTIHIQINSLDVYDLIKNRL